MLLIYFALYGASIVNAVELTCCLVDCGGFPHENIPNCEELLCADNDCFSQGSFDTCCAESCAQYFNDYGCPEGAMADKSGVCGGTNCKFQDNLNCCSPPMCSAVDCEWDGAVLKADAENIRCAFSTCGIDPSNEDFKTCCNGTCKERYIGWEASECPEGSHLLEDVVCDHLYCTESECCSPVESDSDDKDEAVSCAIFNTDKASCKAQTGCKWVRQRNKCKKKKSKCNKIRPRPTTSEECNSFAGCKAKFWRDGSYAKCSGVRKD